MSSPEKEINESSDKPFPTQNINALHEIRKGLYSCVPPTYTL